VGEDIQSFKFNTAISQMMIFMNVAEKATDISVEQYEAFLKVLAPFAPHMTDELWQQLGHETSIHLTEWPVYDESKLLTDTVTIAVQINGKVRTTIEIAAEEREETVKKAAHDAAAKWLEGKTIVRDIYVPKRLVNIVVE
jgi:leucyl-tRNA synthetase